MRKSNQSTNSRPEVQGFRPPTKKELYGHLLPEVYTMMAEGNITQLSLAGRFHVTKQAVSAALHGQSWPLLRKIHDYLNRRQLKQRAKELELSAKGGQ